MQLLVPDLRLLALTFECRQGPLGDGTHACTGVEMKPERMASNRLNFYPCTCVRVVN